MRCCGDAGERRGGHRGFRGVVEGVHVAAEHTPVPSPANRCRTTVICALVRMSITEPKHPGDVGAGKLTIRTRFVT